jgi:type II secretory pathway predicted ATPase ExeA
MHWEVGLKALWGASAMPFGAAVREPYAGAGYASVLARLQQLAGVRAHGLLWGVNGVGKSLLVQQWRASLSPKQYRVWSVTHTSLSGGDLLRHLAHQAGRTPHMWRSDNVRLLQQVWSEGAPLWPVLVIEEAQNLSVAALEEVRLLSCASPDTQSPFSLLLVGDETLLPRLSLGIHRALLSRLGFALELRPLDRAEALAYLENRLRQVAIVSNPLEPPAQELIVQTAQGRPRVLNHLAQRAFEEALLDQSRLVTAAHAQRALDRLPWLARLAES